MTAALHISVIGTVCSMAGEWAVGFLLSIAAAVCLALLLRRFADLLRIPRWNVRGGGPSAKRRMTWTWGVMCSAPMAILIAGWLLAYLAYDKPAWCKDRRRSVQPQLVIYCPQGASFGEAVLAEELRKSGIDLVVKAADEPFAEGLAPLVLYCPESVGGHLPDGRRALVEKALRKSLAQHVLKSGGGLIPVRTSADSQVYRFFVGVPAKPVEFVGTCDPEFASQALPLLAHVLDQSAVQVKYKLDESSSDALQDCGVIRYRTADDRPGAELLAAMLSDMVGLSGIQVSPVPEPALPGTTVNLSYSRSARFMAFVWTVLDEMDAMAIQGRVLSDKVFREPEVRKAAEEWLKTEVPADWILRRAVDFREDWVGRYRGARAFVVGFVPPEGEAATDAERKPPVERVLVCDETGDTWRIVRLEEE